MSVALCVGYGISKPMPAESEHIASLAREIIANHHGNAMRVALAVVEEVSKRRIASAVASTLANREVRRSTPARLVVQMVADYYGLDEDEIYSKFSRRGQRHEVEARIVAMYLLRERLGLSYASIGHEFGRDHTTVLAVLKKHGPRIPAGDIAELNRRLGELEELGGLEAAE